MNNNSHELENADLVSDFIDCLNIEKKPEVDDENLEDLEMLQMFETIRAVKRLKADEGQVENNTRQRWTVLGHIIPIKKFAAAAAIFLVALTSIRALNPSSPFTDKKADEQINTMSAPESRMAKNENSESAEAPNLSSSSMDTNSDNQRNVMLAPENNSSKKQNSENAIALNPSLPPIDTKSEDHMNAVLQPEGKMMGKQSLEDNIAMFAGNSIVYAMERSYEKITGYSGIIEVRSEDESGKVDFLEKIEINYQKPNKYIFVQKYDDQTVTRVSDGEKLYTIDSNLVNIDYLNPEKEIWRFSIGKKIQELKKAADVRQIGAEVISGRETLVYEFSFSNNQPVNKIWVDKSTNMPLKQELNMPDGRKLTNQFVQIQVNPALKDTMFNYKIKEGDRVEYENKKSSLDEIRKVWTYTNALTKSIPDNLKLTKVVKLDNPYEIYDYMMRFNSNDGEQYFDVYITSKYIKDYYIPGSQKGKLKNGWVEMKNDETNIFKVYIGKSNIVRWVTPEFDISIISSLRAENIVEILEDTSGSKIISDIQN
jgi:outer membrane lipoprotein-sorting protein